MSRWLGRFTTCQQVWRLQEIHSNVQLTYISNYGIIMSVDYLSDSQSSRRSTAAAQAYTVHLTTTSGPVSGMDVSLQPLTRSSPVRD